MKIEQARKLKVGDTLRGNGFGEAHETGTVEHVFSDGVQIRCKCGQLNDKVNFDREDAYWSKIELVLEYGSYADVCERDNLQAENHRLARRVQQQRGGLESALLIIAKWKQRALFGRAMVHEAAKKIEETERSAAGWKADWERAARDNAWYRDLLLQIAEVLGPEKFISDDGSIQQDVLIAKIPELARAAIFAPHVAKAKASYVPLPAEPVANCVTSDGCNSAAPQFTGQNKVVGQHRFLAGDHRIDGIVLLTSGLKFPSINPFA